MKKKLLKSFISNSEEDTYNFGVSFGNDLVNGQCVLMYGDPGAGKTVFTKGLAVSLGIKDRVLSPTFALRNDYVGRLSLHHLDMYRIDDESEVYESGALEGIFGENEVTIIEWAENIEGFINFPHMEINIKYIDANKREIELFEVK